MPKWEAHFTHEVSLYFRLASSVLLSICAACQLSASAQTKPKSAETGNPSAKTSAKPPAAKAGAKSQPGAHSKDLVLEFPNDTSYGVIIKLRKGWDIGAKKLLGDKVSDARGRIVLSQDEEYMLTPSYALVEHPEVLGRIPANSFAVVYIDKIDAEDNILPYVCKLSGLKRAEFGDLDCTDKGMENLGGLPNLVFLWLQQGQFTGAFLQHVHPFKHLRYLRITGCPVQTNYLDANSATIPNVRYLHLSGDQLHGDDLLFMRKFPVMEELHIDRNPRLTDSTLKGLLKCKQIGYLNLSGTAVTPEGVKQLKGIRIGGLTVPMQFSQMSANMIKKELNLRTINYTGPVSPDLYRMFAPLH